MTTFAAQPDAARRLAELDALTRGAWTAYRDDLRELEGAAYVDAEAAAWDQLQATLRELDAERAALAAAGAAAD
ncbi:MAG TPA: hypothetical protein VGO81_14745 [Solirubrobacteraceae bacterium]|jgi:hypothetical protein|nr:hypothetical protein [Solirubrobacteraceae bacterium]